jgi:hypothetical protein
MQHATDAFYGYLRGKQSHHFGVARLSPTALSIALVAEFGKACEPPARVCARTM